MPKEHFRQDQTVAFLIRTTRFSRIIYRQKPGRDGPERRLTCGIFWDYRASALALDRTFPAERLTPSR